MITDRDAGRAIRDWLEDEPPILPAHVFEAVIAEIPQVPQRRRRLPFGRADQAWPRWLVAATIALLVLAAAATLVAGALGWLRAHPTPRPLPAQEMPLEAGSYVVDGPFPVRFSLDVPDGWAAVEFDADVGDRSSRSTGWPTADPDDGRRRLCGSVPARGRAHRRRRSIRRGPGRCPRRTPGTWRVRSDGRDAGWPCCIGSAAARACGSSGLSSGGCRLPGLGAPGMFGMPPGARWEVGIVEVDGVRLVVVAEFLAGTTSADEDELDPSVGRSGSARRPRSWHLASRRRVPRTGRRLPSHPFS